MNDVKDDVTAAWRRLKDDDASMTASARVEARLSEEVRLIAARRRRRAKLFVLQAAAIVVLVLGPIAWFLSNRQAPVEVVATASPAQEVVTQYFPLFYSSVPAASVHVVRMEVPRASMVRFGLLPGDALNRTTGTVLADVIVGEDGLARAVRFVQKVSQEQ